MPRLLDQITRAAAEYGAFTTRTGETRFEVERWDHRWTNGQHVLMGYTSEQRMREILDIVRKGLVKCGPECKVCAW